MTSKNPTGFSRGSVKKILNTITMKNLDSPMRFLLIIWIILMFTDVLSTYIVVIKNGGYEINIVGRYLIGLGGLHAILIAKIVVIVAILAVAGIVFPHMDERNKHIVYGVYTGLMLYYVFLNVWNLFMVFEL